MIPLLVRFIPEVLMGPYLVGFDTVAHYVPTTLHWLDGNVDFEFRRYCAIALLLRLTLQYLIFSASACPVLGFGLAVYFGRRVWVGAG